MEKYSESNLYSDFDEISRSPMFVKTLNDYQLERLLDFATQRKQTEEGRHAEILSMNPQLPLNWPGSNHRQVSILVERVLIKEINGRQKTTNANKFVKSKDEQIENGKKGGKQKGENMKNALITFIKKNNFDLEAYKDKGNESLSIALKDKGFSISAKTIGDLRKTISQEIQTGK